MAAISRRTAAIGLSALGLVMHAPSALAAEEANMPSEADVLRILRERIDEQRQSLGIAVGLVGDGARRTVCHGVLGSQDSRPVTRETVFPIASVTKVFIALLLADAVARGEMRLDDAVTEHIPGLRLPLRAGQPITLGELGMHMSGLPVYPPDYPEEHETALRVRYTHGMLYEALADIQLISPLAWRYSSVGPQLIADALAHRTDTSFDMLLKRRVTDELGMDSTAFAPTRAMSARWTAGHNAQLQPVPFDPQPAMPAAGDLLSTADDMTKLLAAFMGLRRTRLAPAMAAMELPRAAMPYPNSEQALGIQVTRVGATQTFGHNGSRDGGSASMHWSPSKLGVVALSNAAPPVDDIAHHLIDATWPLRAPVQSGYAVSVETLARYAGRYRERAQGIIIAVTLEGGELLLEAIGQTPKIALSPEGPDAFNIPRMGARVEFRAPDVLWLGLAGLEYTADRIP